MRTNVAIAALSAAVSIIVALFILFPTKMEFDQARDNIRMGIRERDERMNYLQSQIDDVEQQIREMKR